MNVLVNSFEEILNLDIDTVHLNFGLHSVPYASTRVSNLITIRIVLNQFVSRLYGSASKGLILLVALLCFI